MSYVLDERELGARKRAAQVLTDGERRDDVVRALEHQRGSLELGDLPSHVGEKGDPRELFGDVRIGPTEAVRELDRQLWLLRCAHDRYPEKKLSYAWVVGDMALDTIVTFTLTPTDSGTRLLLVQSGFKPEQKQNFGGARYGWNMMGGKLVDLLSKTE